MEGWAVIQDSRLAFPNGALEPNRKILTRQKACQIALRLVKCQPNNMKIMYIGLALRVL